MRRIWTAAAFALVMTAQSATAHEPYILPGSFAPEGVVSVQASLTEGVFFVPDFALRGAQMQLVSPSGVRAPMPRIMEFRQVTAAEADLPDAGTYRITAGPWMGRVTRAVRDGREWRAVRPNETLASNARVVETRNYITAETYVTRGAPSAGALATTGQGFELRPVTHPNEIFVEDGFTFELLFDGRPAPGVRYDIQRGNDQYSGQRIATDGVTDALGRATAAFTHQGVYVLEARYPVRRQGASPPAAAYLYTLTFEVTQ